MHPDLVAEFVAEYQREWNRLRAETLGARQVRNIVEAVKAGFFAPAMKEEMAALEARQAELRAGLEEAPAEAPPALHPGLAEAYRRKVGELSAALNEPALRQEAAEALRPLIGRIRLIPQQGAVAIELVGELAGILALANGKRPRPSGQGRQSTLVAGAGFDGNPYSPSGGVGQAVLWMAWTVRTTSVRKAAGGPRYPSSLRPTLLWGLREGCDPISANRFPDRNVRLRRVEEWQYPPGRCRGSPPCPWRDRRPAAAGSGRSTTPS